jgi:hypothetical protein
MGATDRGSGCLGQPEMHHLARVNQFLHGAGDILDRHLGVDPVLVVQVDVVGAKPAQ